MHQHCAFSGNLCKWRSQRQRGHNAQRLKFCTGTWLAGSSVDAAQIGYQKTGSARTGATATVYSLDANAAMPTLNIILLRSVDGKYSQSRTVAAGAGMCLMFMVVWV